MTNLTEQLKKGELPDNHHYYYRLPKGTYEVGNTFCLETLRYCKDGDKIEVLSEVPTYEKWIMTKNLSERAHLKMYKARGEKVRLEKENTKLKELLKEVRGKLKYINTPRNDHNIFGNDLMKRINQVLGEE